MIRYLLRRTLRISLAIITVLCVAFAIILALNPSAAIILAGICLQSIFGNTRPPPIARDQLVDMDWRTQKEASERLAVLLHQKFPKGSSASDLRSMLVSQGFEPPPPPSPDCLPPDQVAPIGKTVIRCPVNNGSKVLRYSWGNGICRHNIIVKWSTDDNETIKEVHATYYSYCL
jgi:hypothetical protein